MNKTYKVVFNKARGALMAANEITSSVQKKGTKTVIVTAVVSALAMISAGANADNLTRLDDTVSNLSNQIISGKSDFSNSGWGGYIYIGAKNFSSENNTYSVEGDYSTGDGAFGGAIALYSKGTNGKTLHFDTFKNDKFIGNSLVATGTNSEKVAWNAGGAIAVKGHSVTFENVLFQDNKVVSNVSDKGGVAVGGAVFLDKMIRGTETNNVGEKDANTNALFKITKDLSYTGNTVSSSSKQGTTLYGGYAPTGGGFLFMDRQSTATFDVAENVTLTLGAAGKSTDAHMDTIASSMTSDNGNNGVSRTGGHNLIVKQGKGTFVINTSLSGYNGLLSIKEGTLDVNAAWKIRNAVTIEGGTLDLTGSDFSFNSIADAGMEYSQKIDSTAAGSITLTSGSLVANSAQIFTQSLGTDGTVKNAEALKNPDKITFNGGTLTLADDAYNLDYSNSAAGLIGAKTSLVFTGKLIGTDGGKVTEITPDQISNTGTGGVLADVDLNTKTEGDTVKNVVIGSGPDATIKGNVGVKSLATDEGASVTVKNSKVLTLVGSGEADALVTGAKEISVASDAKIALGVEGEAAKGSVISQVLKLSGSMEVVGDATYTVEKIEATRDAVITVGNDNASGALKLAGKLNGAKIFLDPAFKNNAELDVIANASSIELSQTLADGLITAGRNSFVVLGGTRADAIDLFNQSGKTRGPENVTAMAYVAAPVDLGTTGGLSIDGAISDAAHANAQTNAVNIAANGLLVVNASGLSGEAAVSNVNSVTGSGTVLAVGAKNGDAFTLFAPSEGSTLTVSSDIKTEVRNPLLAATLQNGVLSVGLSDAAEAQTSEIQGGLPLLSAALSDQSAANFLESVYMGASSAEASRTVDVASQIAAAAGAQRMAVQAMNDQVDAIYDALNASADGIRGWAAITGSRVKVDDLSAGSRDYGVKTEMGGASFGATWTAGDFSLGAALHAGTGTSRGQGRFSGAKAEADYCGISAYGAFQLPFETVLKGVVGWSSSDNDYSFKGLKASGDTDVIYAGLRAEKAFALSLNASVTPYVGFTYARVEADAVTMGFANDKTTQDIVEIPVGARFAATFNQNGWKLSPILDVNFTPTAGDRDVETKSYGAAVTTDVLTKGVANVRAGLDAENGAFRVGLDLGGSFGTEDTRGFSGRIRVGYAF